MKKTICLIIALMLALSTVTALADMQKTDQTKITFRVQGTYEWSIPIDFTMRYVFDAASAIPAEDQQFAGGTIGIWPDASPAPVAKGETNNWPADTTYPGGDLAIWNIKVGTSKQVDIYMKSENNYSLKYTGSDATPANIGYELYFGDINSESLLNLTVTEDITFKKSTVEDVVYLMSATTGDDIVSTVLTPVVKSFRYRNTNYPEKLGEYKDTITFYAILNPIA